MFFSLLPELPVQYMFLNSFIVALFAQAQYSVTIWYIFGNYIYRAGCLTVARFARAPPLARVVQLLC